MRRRTLLATAGVLATAGCSEILPPPRETETDDNGTDATTTSDSLPDEVGTTESATTTEQGPDTPSQVEQETAAVIETARGHLRPAYEAYVGFAEAEDATLLDVTAATQVGVDRVTRNASEARSALDEAPEFAPEQQRETIEGLHGMAVFLGAGIRCQLDLHKTYQQFTFLIDEFYRERFVDVDVRITELRNRWDETATHFQRIRKETAPEHAAAFDPISESDYQEKFDQLERAVTGFDTLADVAETWPKGLQAFESATSNYYGENYRTAAEKWSTAATEIQAAHDDLTAMTAPESVIDLVAELRTVTDAVGTGAEKLAEAADLAAQVRWQDHKEPRDEGVAELQTSEVAVERIEPVSKLVRLEG
jgi:hypothetical protein